MVFGAQRKCIQHEQVITFLNLSQGPTYVCQRCQLNNRQSKQLIEYSKFRQKLIKLMDHSPEGKKSFVKLSQAIKYIFNQAKSKIQNHYAVEEKRIIQLHFKKPSQDSMIQLLFEDTPIQNLVDIKKIIKDIAQSPLVQVVDQNIHYINVLSSLQKYINQDMLVSNNFNLKLNTQKIDLLLQQQKNRLSKHSRQYALKYKNRADKMYDFKDFQKAIQVYSRSIQMDPTLYSAFNRRGNCYHMLQQYIKALQDFDQAIKLKQDFSIAYYNKGNALRKLKRYKQSIQQFDKAIKYNPSHSDSYINMGVSYKNLKQLDQAVNSYEKALNINPQDHVGHYNMALCLIKLGKNEQALDSYNKAITYQPNSKKYMQQKADLLTKMGRQSQAREILQKYKQL